MNYYEFSFSVNTEEEFYQDLLINALAEAGFDTFEETPNGFNAYISAQEFDQDLFDSVLSPYLDMFEFSFEKELIPQKNWNEVWESNFEPLVIKDQCYVRATFHQPQPQYPYEIIIDPKMAFGTGHHQTTTMMMEYILEEEMNNASVLDMGCGTGILAILAEKRGAGELLAIDYDPVCYESTIENSKLNQCSSISALCGSKEVIPDKEINIIFANINRNILLDQIHRYTEVLKPGGILLMSGFYQEDISLISEECERHNLSFSNFKSLNNWVSVKFVKQKLN
ncbi:50S ribosomal protein L11 methyltransferase [Desertivirga brevis]|uniref:50S ribosomal protein L11 methyltransferase n=1 Tax=Desertivirga brevis TaxID=2810310 RepID=UPI001A971490|nr:50S ribosomal protein L11 methyltransferase [Pedobacter sp. SYSU D00873]